MSDLLIRHRTQALNALRGHLGKFGQIVPQDAATAARLIAIVEDPDSGDTDARLTLWHKTHQKYGTIHSTLADATELSGTVRRKG